MTKIVSDKSTRQQAIPFVADGFGGSGSSFLLDYYRYIIGVDSDDLTVYIRCPTPSHANLIEAHLTLIMTVDSALSVKIAIGRFSADGVTAATLTDTEIEAGHRQLAGTDSDFASSAGTLLIDGLNLIKGIPKRGDANFNEDGFVLVLQFSRARTDNDSLLKFDPLCSALMGLV